jgi:hypothetical protein
VNSKRFGEPLASVTLSSVAAARIAWVTCAGVAFGFTARYSAAAPATCGLAIEVPLRTAVPVFESMAAETISEPGA